MPHPAIRNFDHLKKLATPQPWQIPPTYQVTTIIPTIGESPTLLTTITTLNRQTVKQRIIVIDTGSTGQQLINLIDRVDPFTNVEILHIAPRAWQHLSEPVAAAIDLGFSIAETPSVFLTHDDVAIRRTDFLWSLIDLLFRTGAIAVGYEMSPRDHVTDQWQGCLSHTATLLATKPCRKHAMRWSLQEALNDPTCDTKPGGWPDTETAFGLRRKILDLPIRFIGHETNEPHFLDSNLEHRRSLTTHLHLWPQLAKDDVDWVADFNRRYMEPDCG